MITYDKSKKQSKFSRDLFHKKAHSGERTHQIYESLSISWDKEEIKNRKDAVLLARLRSGLKYSEIFRCREQKSYDIKFACVYVSI